MLAISEKFKTKPLAYYGMSIAASWAGVGSLLNTITITKTLGIIPALIWTAANVFACILFGLVINRLPTLREVIKTKAVCGVISLMAVFQIWLNMNGIREVFSDTALGLSGGTILAYVTAIFFVVLLLWRGMIRNILTDGASWLAVYGLVAFITLAASIHSGGEFLSCPLGLETAALTTGLHKAFLLLPGPFTYFYFYELLNYNDANTDATQKVDMLKAFTLGGLFFGLYMIFTFTLAFVNFPPELNLIKAVLLSLVAVSSLSTFIYSIYLVFGRKLGLLIDAAAILGWTQFIDMGVMGVWTLLASIRSYLVGAMLLAAMVMAVRSGHEKNIRTQAEHEASR
ncbi:MAG: hypothetical protein II857_02805 [Selenomonadaceae bacterium]|nr:hypothetical protein [Selenomonadaceae bacterium]